MNVDPSAARVGPTARLLGAAGLLPQLGALAIKTANPGAETGEIAAFGYASLILRFLERDYRWSAA